MNIPLVPLIHKTGLRYGIVLGAASSVLFLTFAWLKINSNWMLMLPWFAFAIALTYLAHLYFKENNDGGTMTFGQGVIVSIWMGLASGILTSLVTYVYVRFINTAYIADIVDAMRIEMEKKGLSDEQIDTNLNMTKLFRVPEMMLVSGIFSTIFYAFVVGLVVSLITKKDPPATF